MGTSDVASANGGVERVREKGEPLYRTQGFKTHRAHEIAAIEATTGTVFLYWLEIDLWTKVPVFGKLKT